MDETLDPTGYQPEEVEEVIEIALLCTQSTVAARPTLSEVVVLLLSKDKPIQPTRPPFIDAMRRVRVDSYSSGSFSVSNATISILEFSSR